MRMTQDHILLRDRLALSYVRRWVINPTLREQSVAEHTYRVLAIALFLLEYVRGNGEFDDPNVDTLRLVLDIVDHDIEEVHTGDVPSTGKHKTGSVPVETDWHVRIRKVADSIETFSFWRQWGHHAIGNLPHDPLSNPQGQWETKRVLAYTEGWPALREGAAEVLRLLGCHMNGVSH